jgi:hypothetical protein
VVVTASGAGLIVMLRFDVADCGEGVVESVTLIAADALPMELCAGVPVIAPVEALIASPLGRLFALYVYGVVPPVAVTGLLYAAPTVPPGREAVATVRLPGGTVIVGVLLAEPHPARNATATTIRLGPGLRMSTIPIQTGKYRLISGDETTGYEGIAVSLCSLMLNLDQESVTSEGDIRAGTHAKVVVTT